MKVKYRETTFPAAMRHGLTAHDINHALAHRRSNRALKNGGVPVVADDGEVFRITESYESGLCIWREIRPSMTEATA